MRYLGFCLIPLFILAACSAEDEVQGQVSVPGVQGALKTSAIYRADRRLFDGAPPVIGHQNLGGNCTVCHDADGTAVPELGFAPPMPHGDTDGLSQESRCTQCHVFATTDEVFVPNDYLPYAQDLRHGERLNDMAPPVVPHPKLLRENCSACHDGPAAREEIRCSHPERTTCTQCHVFQQETSLFER